ncbi:MAG: radical SAM family heme chaperone HemW [Anaerolineae bacterium]|nr:radical SAM family heme chaperone HemW [Anaerolineae bacterium]
MPSLFVYVPYCPSICAYCDFNVYARREDEFDAYADAVVREIEITATTIQSPRLAKSLALGGGTPSVLSEAQLGRIVAAVRAHFEFVPDAEWSIEVNPGTVDLTKLRALREMGFGRLSLGVQTFDDRRLESFNRKHTVAQSYEGFEWAREAGFENINLDLIYGLPDQTAADWEKTLERALAFWSEHLSLYGLQVEERTVLKKQIERGKVTKPDPEIAAEMYETAVRVLGRAGFTHYEISNFARPGFESAHNKTYWLNESYLGFGAGAHSFWRGERYENVKLPRVYLRRIHEGTLPIASRETISRPMQMAETVFLGLRLSEGVSWARFSDRFGEDARVVYREPLEFLAASGMLVTDDERMRLTEEGMLLSNQLLWRFLPDED